MAPLTIEDAKTIFDNFNKAMLAGNIDQALPFRTEEPKKALLEASKTPAEKEEMLNMFKLMTPLSYTADHLDQKDKKAQLYITANFQNPETPDQNLVQEVLLMFENDGTVWKMGNITFLIDIDSIKKSPDQNFEPASNYDLDRHTSIGGRITSVKFENNYTLVIIRMLDEDDLIFLPAKAELEKSGLDTTQLAPWKILSASGHPHKSNTFKYFCEQAEIVEPSFDF